MAATLALAAAALAALPAEPAASVTLAGTAVRASEIGIVPPEFDAVIARLPADVDAVTLGEPERRALLRNRYPGRHFPLRHSGPLLIRRHPAEASGGECRITEVSVAAGSYLDEADLVSTACPVDLAGGWLGYDGAAKAYYARRDIPAGAHLGRLAVKAPPATIAGAEVTYRTSEGPVTVERRATALQPARDGRRVFVRTEDGEILSAPLQAAQP